MDKIHCQRWNIQTWKSENNCQEIKKCMNSRATLRTTILYTSTVCLSSTKYMANSMLTYHQCRLQNLHTNKGTTKRLNINRTTANYTTRDWNCNNKRAVDVTASRRSAGQRAAGTRAHACTLPLQTLHIPPCKHNLTNAVLPTFCTLLIVTSTSIVSIVSESPVLFF